MYSSSYSYNPGFGLGSLIYWGLIAFGLWGIFKKAGKPGWPAVVPFYSFYVLMQVIGWPEIWTLALLAAFIPFIGWLGLLILHIFVAIDVGKSFGVSDAFVVGLILLPFVFYPILGWGSAQYRGPARQRSFPPGYPPPPPPGGGYPPPPPSNPPPQDR
jgi:hypothetical protein